MSLQSLSPLSLQQLRDSGLTDVSIVAMQLTGLTPDQCQQILGRKAVPKSGGYLIPYFDIRGNKISFSRVRFVPPLIGQDEKPVRYSQPRGTSTHAYLPPFVGEDRWKDAAELIVITEGEKKAAKAAQEGLVCVGLGGVDNWRCKTFEVAAESVDPHPTKEGVFVIRKVSKGRDIRTIEEKIAEELLDITFTGRQVLIAFDSDTADKPRIQEAVFGLDCYLYTQDCASVEQVILPPLADGSKQGLDDYLLTHTVQEFLTLPRVQPFPPNVRGWLRNELGQPKRLGRDGIMTCSRAVSGSLLNRGSMFTDSDTAEHFYFDHRTKELHEVEVAGESLKTLNSRSFGRLLHRDYGIDSSDSALLNRVLVNLACSPAVKPVRPRRVCWCSREALYYQVSNSRVAKVTANSLSLVSNGHDEILFRTNDVHPVDAELERLLDGGTDLQQPRWLETIREMPNVRAMEGLTVAETKLYLTILCYLNPWFRRWRDLILPIEIFCAEPGGGKSSLYELRRGILTGKPDLNSAPIEKKDWYASLTHTPAMWIWDNARQVPKSIDNMSEELCRMITSLNPKIEMRKYFTENQQITPSIDLTFAVTCTSNPFHRSDLLERSACFQTNKIDGKKDGSWAARRLRDRPLWVLDHLLVAQRFLAIADQQWNDYFEASNRLPNFEQAVLLMGTALGQEEMAQSLVSKFDQVTNALIVRHDPAMEGLVFFGDHCRSKGKTGMAHLCRTTDICERDRWDLGDAFSNVNIFKSAASLGNYLSKHEQAILSMARMQRHWDEKQRVYLLEILP